MFFSKQHRALLERKLPDSLKFEIAKRIENNMFSKVLTHLKLFSIRQIKILRMQVPFLSGMKGIGQIRTTFSAEVLKRCKPSNFKQLCIFQRCSRLIEFVCVLFVFLAHDAELDKIFLRGQHCGRQQRAEPRPDGHHLWSCRGGTANGFR